jgi:hypothetical protein
MRLLVFYKETFVLFDQFLYVSQTVPISIIVETEADYAED